MAVYVGLNMVYPWYIHSADVKGKPGLIRNGTRNILMQRFITIT